MMMSLLAAKMTTIQQKKLLNSGNVFALTCFKGSAFAGLFLCNFSRVKLATIIAGGHF